MLQANADARLRLVDVHESLNSVEVTDRPILKWCICFARAYICMVTTVASIILMIAQCCGCCLDNAISSYISELERGIVERRPPANQSNRRIEIECLQLWISIILAASALTLYAGIIWPYYIFLLFYCIGVCLHWCYTFMQDRNSNAVAPAPTTEPPIVPSETNQHDIEAQIVSENASLSLKPAATVSPTSVAGTTPPAGAMVDPVAAQVFDVKVERPQEQLMER